MPELPEVETVRRTLEPIVGATTQSLWYSGKALRLARPVDIRALRKASAKNRICGVRRLGKYLLVDFAEGQACVLVHLGMSGRFRIFAEGEPRPAHTHLDWTLADGRHLRFSDPRRFGQVEALLQGREREHPSLARLGPDPITDELSLAEFHAACKRRSSPIKVVLLDQKLIAGIGNIYASEALHRAAIHPATPASRLSRPRCQRLLEAVGEVLRRALDHGGTSLRDFVAADGHAGEHAHYLWVYDRAGQPCPREGCTGQIRRQVQQQRATFYCPRCQKR